MTNEIKFGESVQRIVLVEAKWFKSGQLLRAEGYLKNNGIISCEVNVVMVHIVSLLGEGITNRSVELLNGIAAIISSTAAILRLWDELESKKNENQDGHEAEQRIGVSYQQP
ncbi:hypothetical protein ACFX1Z_036563 [Malus domestica]